MVFCFPTKSLILWGGEGILGTGPPDVSDKPVRVNKKARAIGAGFDHYIALKTDR